MMPTQAKHGAGSRAGYPSLQGPAPPVAYLVGVRSWLVHVPPLVGFALTELVGLMMRDLAPARDEIDGLMAGLMTSDAPPIGHDKDERVAQGQIGRPGTLVRVRALAKLQTVEGDNGLPSGFDSIDFIGRLGHSLVRQVEEARQATTRPLIGAAIESPVRKRLEQILPRGIAVGS